MSVLIVVSGAPYGTESTYNALRLAMSFGRQNETAELRVFLLGDAVVCAVPAQRTPSGYYNVEKMLRHILAGGSEIRACLTCMEARGLTAIELIEGIEPSNVDELAAWVSESDKVVTF